MKRETFISGPGMRNESGNHDTDFRGGEFVRPMSALIRGVLSVTFAAGASAALLGCGGGSGSDEPRFEGQWTVRYGTLEDGCFLIDPSLVGFNDQYVISANGNELSLRSTEGFIADARGAVDGEDSFTVEEVVEGDPYGTGLPCLTQLRVSFSKLNDGETRADSLLDLQRECADGTVCATRAVGTAAREPL